MNIQVQDFLPVLNIVLLIGLAVGGFVAMRKGYSQEAGKIQESTIDALKEEVASLRRKMDDLEKERATQDRVIATIRYALKQYGLRVTISGDFVTLQDSSGKSKSTHIQDRASIQPIVSLDENDSGTL